MPPSDPSPGGADDFDFLIGDWSVRHRRLKRRLVGDTEWIEFTAPASVHKILNGLGNIDELRIDLPEGAYAGATPALVRPGVRPVDDLLDGQAQPKTGPADGRQLQWRP
jgi:hypothetical protein